MEKTKAAQAAQDEQTLSKTIYTTKEAAAFLGISLDYLYKIMWLGKIAYFKSRGGKMCYFKAQDLEDWCLGVRVATDKETEAMAAAHCMKKGGKQ